MFSNTDNIYAKETGMYGMSLYAARDFALGEVVFVAQGAVTATPNLYTIPIAYDLFIEPREPKDNVCQYICHSCDPNLGVKGRTMFVARRAIAKDEEVTIDYAMIVPVFPRASWPGWEGWKCLCGRASCRGVVKGYHELTAEQQAAYEGYVSDYLLTYQSPTG